MNDPELSKSSLQTVQLSKSRCMDIKPNTVGLASGVEKSVPNKMSGLRFRLAQDLDLQVNQLNLLSRSRNPCSLVANVYPNSSVQLTCCDPVVGNSRFGSGTKLDNLSKLIETYVVRCNKAEREALKDEEH